MSHYGNMDKHTHSATDSGASEALELFPLHTEMMDKWRKKPTLSPNFEQIVQNEFAILYPHKTQKLGSTRHETPKTKSVKIEAP